MLFARVNGQHTGATMYGDRSTPQAQILSESPLKMVDLVQKEIERSTGILSDSALAEYHAALRYFESLSTEESQEP
jgi:hypothetical protein